MQLQSLHVYPVKSASGITAERWEVDELGLRGDRRFVVVQPDGRFLTQRTHPRLALIKTAIADDLLRLRAPGIPDLHTKLRPTSGRATRVTVWNDTCDAWLCDDDAHSWLAHLLEERCLLAYMPDDAVRPLDPERAAPGRRVSFADAYPFLLLGEGSLEDLNRRLAAPVPMNRFRPNLVVAGAPPYGEDQWRRVRIGTLEFDVVKPCARCAIPTVDQETGQRSAEPMKTLAQYRRIGDEVFFGQNLVHQGTGVLSVGDEVEVVA